MSIHNSLLIKSSLKRHRNVLTRAERLDILEKSGKWHEGDSIYDLPKVKGELKIKKTKAVKEEKVEEKKPEEKKAEE